MRALAPDLKTKIQERESEQKSRHEIDLTGHVNERRRKSYRYQQKQGQDHLPGQCFSFRFDHSQHLDAAALVIFPVHPGDGMEVRELPKEQHAKENPRLECEMTTCCCKSDQWRHSSRNR